MTDNTAIVNVFLTLKDDAQDFNTLELVFEPEISSTDLGDHFDNPEQKIPLRNPQRTPRHQNVESRTEQPRRKTIQNQNRNYHPRP